MQDNQVVSSVTQVMSVLKTLDATKKHLAREKTRLQSDCDHDIALCDGSPEFNFKTIKIEGDLTLLTPEKLLLLKKSLEEMKTGIDRIMSDKITELAQREEKLKTDLESMGLSAFYETAKMMLEFNF